MAVPVSRAAVATWRCDKCTSPPSYLAKCTLTSVLCRRGACAPDMCMSHSAHSTMHQHASERLRVEPRVVSEFQATSSLSTSLDISTRSQTSRLLMGIHTSTQYHTHIDVPATFGCSDIVTTLHPCQTAFGCPIPKCLGLSSPLSQCHCAAEPSSSACLQLPCWALSGSATKRNQLL